MTTRLLDPLPPIPAVSHMIGLTGFGAIHAISYRCAVRAVKDGDSNSQRVTAPAECGTTAAIARRWGGFARGNHHVDRQQVCPHCAWAVALHHGTTDAELATLTPTGAGCDALAVVLPDPLILVRICRAILADRETGREYGPEHERWARLLGHVTAHRPVLLIDEDCAEDACGHDDPGDCYGTNTVVACMACSVLTGSESGEWQGYVDVRVDAPCSVLTTFAAQSTSDIEVRCG